MFLDHGVGLLYDGLILFSTLFVNIMCHTLSDGPCDQGRIKV